jgi:hypothetical protein
LFVPNFDPNGGLCNTYPGCSQFVNTATGAIVRPGIAADGSGIVGEQFWLVPDCISPGNPGSCALRNQVGNPTNPIIEANYLTPTGEGPPTPSMPNLEYVPGLAPTSASASTAIPTCPGVALVNTYSQAVAGCDQATQYQCGIPGQNTIDLTENPVYPLGSGDTTSGGQCLIHQPVGSSGVGSGQDQLLPAVGGTYPFQIQAGSNNPMVVAPGGLTANTLISSSTSIVSLPIYDSTQTITQSGPNNVTVIGFLQVFINQVDGNGNVNVTVMNVTGCGPAPGTAYIGTSSVPVRLITSP